MTRPILPTLLALAVAVLFGLVPLRECRATSGGGVVLAGAHAHAGSCCDGTTADADLHDCACAHESVRDGVGTRDEGPRERPSTGMPPPVGEHVPCCIDGAASILVTGCAVVLPPPSVWSVLDATIAPAPAAAESRTEAKADPDPGDGPPDGVVAVVLLR